MNIRIIRIIVGLAGTFFLVLALYYVPKNALGASLASADRIWIGAAMLAQLCVPLPIALGAGLLVRGSGISLYAILARREFKISPGRA